MNTPDQISNFKEFLDEFKKLNTRDFLLQGLQVKYEREMAGEDNDKREEQLDSIDENIRSIKESLAGNVTNNGLKIDLDTTGITEQLKTAVEELTIIRKVNEGSLEYDQAAAQYRNTSGRDITNPTTGKVSKKGGFIGFETAGARMAGQSKAAMARAGAVNPEADNITTSEEIIAEAAEEDVELTKKTNELLEEQLKELRKMGDGLKVTPSKEITKKKEEKEKEEKTEEGSSLIGDLLSALGGLAAGGGLKGLGKAALGFGKAALPYAAAAGVAVAGGAAVDYGLGKLGVGKDKEGNDLKVNETQDEANWQRMSFGQKLQSGAARGIEKAGSFLFLDNMAREARAKRVEKETAYLDKTTFSTAGNRLPTTEQAGKPATAADAMPVSQPGKPVTAADRLPAAAPAAVPVTAPVTPAPVAAAAPGPTAAVTPAVTTGTPPIGEKAAGAVTGTSQKEPSKEIGPNYKAFLADLKESTPADHLEKQYPGVKEKYRELAQKTRPRSDSLQSIDTHSKMLVAMALGELEKAKKESATVDQAPKPLEGQEKLEALKAQREKEVQRGPAIDSARGHQTHKTVIENYDKAIAEEERKLKEAKPGAAPAKGAESAAVTGTGMKGEKVSIKGRATADDPKIYDEEYNKARSEGKTVAESKKIAMDAVSANRDKVLGPEAATTPAVAPAEKSSVSAKTLSSQDKKDADAILKEYPPDKFTYHPSKSGIRSITIKDKNSGEVVASRELGPRSFVTGKELADYLNQSAGGKNAGTKGLLPEAKKQEPTLGKRITNALTNVASFLTGSGSARASEGPDWSKGPTIDSPTINGLQRSVNTETGATKDTYAAGPMYATQVKDKAGKSLGGELDVNLGEGGVNIKENALGVQTRRGRGNLADADLVKNEDVLARARESMGAKVTQASIENKDLAREAAKPAPAVQPIVSTSVNNVNKTSFVPIKGSPRPEYSGSALDRYKDRVAVY